MKPGFQKDFYNFQTKSKSSKIVTVCLKFKSKNSAI